MTPFEQGSQDKTLGVKEPNPPYQPNSWHYRDYVAGWFSADSPDTHDIACEYEGSLGTPISTSRY